MIALCTAKIKDYKSIAQLHTINWQQTYRGILSDDYLDNKAAAERLAFWKERLTNPPVNQVIKVAMREDKLVGFSSLFLNDDENFGSLLDNLHVSSSLQKSGIGKLLMQDCANTILAKATSKKMYLWVFETNNNARKVYERLGGVNTETTLHHNKDGTTANACRYVWEEVSIFLTGA
jgi:ribosomal protein S18 acetylase RimI-like enzyme